MFTVEYLGSRVQCGGDVADVTHCMNIVQAQFSSLYHMWNDHRLPTSMKLRLYKTAVCFSLTHACEAWDMSQRVTRSINGFNSRCLQLITKKSYRSTATDPDFNLVLAIRRRRLRFLGHILRMDDSRLLKQSLTAYVRGGTAPPTGSLMMDCENIPLVKLKLAAEDRTAWRRRVEDLY